ncbi:4Fe-4S dicluster domain-containing protein [Cupriavidus sp.]|uniref:4Fe-4S dicluster domain-containing protein n=2 Tax=unclassified Cupriavidus TaxID=2640874 RepID=UPI0025C1A651|nr:4Fe-4S dicluster domain-containing protein [Cupriavidus sp.]MCA3189048.1 4Fe-4S dicluster domain-containing protein [Cupriavidus sp.]MCA3198767.1 4Fe-4S dicluster domain-containing protein [Cupriavidus sp.]MCA3201513.1 4Fe-4S dicluster domain-containing protein [Cupriavidus sp.]MCA3209931.1 4Fe-4S dicluster domain-containing protein [Cupriavidus sp.]
MTHRPVIPIVPASEAPAAADDPDSHARRNFLRVMAASAALASGACSGPPRETIVPYVHMPEGLVPGRPLFYATALTRHGYGTGVLVESNMGRPTKIEGNPRHPASLGATHPFDQAAVLQLWDPDRSQAPYRGPAMSTWQSFDAALAVQRTQWRDRDGEGLRLLTGNVGSPTLAAQIARWLERYPKAVWHAHDPVQDGSPGIDLAFGDGVDPVLDPTPARIVVTFDADLVGHGPGAVRQAHDLMADRRGVAPALARRLYAIESSPSLTGEIADNRLALPPHEIEPLAWSLARRLGVPDAAAASLPDDATARRWLDVLARRLADILPGQSLLVPGDGLSPATQALIWRLNARLGNLGKTVRTVERAPRRPRGDGHSIAALTQAMRAGQVSALLIVDANPAYDAPFDVDFAGALGHVPWSAHLGLYRDETARLTTWHLPMAHDLERWSDAHAWDGTASIVQPLIAPLNGGRSAHELLSAATDDEPASGHAIVRGHWQRHRPSGFDDFWQLALRTGVIPDSAARTMRPATSRPIAPPPFTAAPLVARFTPDPAADAGELANNAWLQELPRALTRHTWDNAALIGPQTARARHLATGDIVRIRRADGRSRPVEAPVWVTPRHAEGVVTLPLGYGRRHAGRVGNGVGFDAYVLRASDGPHAIAMEATGATHTFAVVQTQTSMAGRELAPAATVSEYRRHPHFATQDAPRAAGSLYPRWPYPHERWGMTVDLNACIGCNACTIACQAENNIPVVGKTEVGRGRVMHWIRVDRYDDGHDTDGQPIRTVFQPVPCMHCEDAPCELVCPVGATVHDSAGLNVQVYNRCVGTRFCSNNCPYKVRRFNFLQYSNQGDDRPPPAYNPEVTVRRRGVMEKCTYCLQRITRARIEAEKLGRPLRDGDVVTACQASCPTQAIAFGNLDDPDSQVAQLKQAPRNFDLLAELNTRPRTSYAALVTNPDEDLA